MRLRIGVNVGDVILDEGDLYGDGVNVAARLEHQRAPQVVEMLADELALLEDRPPFDRREAIDDEPERFACRVCVDRPDLIHRSAGCRHRLAEPAVQPVKTFPDPLVEPAEGSVPAGIRLVAFVLRRGPEQPVERQLRGFVGEDRVVPAVEHEQADVAVGGRRPPRPRSRGRMRAQALAALEAFHRANPLKPGMSREELRGRAGAAGGAAAGPGAAAPLLGGVAAAAGERLFTSHPATARRPAGRLAAGAGPGAGAARLVLRQATHARRPGGGSGDPAV